MDEKWDFQLKWLWTREKKKERAETKNKWMQSPVRNKDDVLSSSKFIKLNENQKQKQKRDGKKHRGFNCQKRHKHARE